MNKSKWDAPWTALHIEALWEESGSDIHRKTVADLIGPLTGRFLDLGCGSARIAPFLEGGQYIGVDASEEMLKIAETRVPPERLRFADFAVEKLPFRKGSFNTALCMEVIRHLSSYESVLLELARVVRKKIYIVDVFRNSQESGFGQEQVLDQIFPNNCWSLPQFLADVNKHFSGWDIEIHMLNNGELAIQIEAPI